MNSRRRDCLNEINIRFSSTRCNLSHSSSKNIKKCSKWRYSRVQSSQVWNLNWLSHSQVPTLTPLQTQTNGQKDNNKQNSNSIHINANKFIISSPKRLRHKSRQGPSITKARGQKNNAEIRTAKPKGSNIFFCGNAFPIYMMQWGIYLGFLRTRSIRLDFTEDGSIYH